ncbi:MFS transporter [Nocardia sp. X0981]
MQLPDNIPPWVADIVIGHIPVCDPAAMRRCADYLSATANSLVLLADELDQVALDQLHEAVEGAAGEVIAEQIRTVAADKRQLAEGFDALAGKTYEAATALEFQQYLAAGIAAALALQLTVSLAMFAAGGSMMAVAQRLAAKEAVTLGWRNMLSWMAQILAKWVVRFPRLSMTVGAAMLGMAIGGTVNWGAQRVQVAQGNRDEVNWREVGVAVVAGGVGGAVGAPIGRAIAAAVSRRTLTSPSKAARMRGQVLATLAAGAVGGVSGGVAGGLAAYAVTNGELRRQDLINMAITGAGSGVVGSVGSSLHSARAAARSSPLPTNSAPGRDFPDIASGNGDTADSSASAPVAGGPRVSGGSVRAPRPSLRDGHAPRPRHLTSADMANGDEVPAGLAGRVDEVFQRTTVKPADFAEGGPRTAAENFVAEQQGLPRRSGVGPAEGNGTSTPKDNGAQPGSQSGQRGPGAPASTLAPTGGHPAPSGAVSAAPEARPVRPAPSVSAAPDTLPPPISAEPIAPGGVAEAPGGEVTARAATPATETSSGPLRDAGSTEVGTGPEHIPPGHDGLTPNRGDGGTVADHGPGPTTGERGAAPIGNADDGPPATGDGGWAHRSLSDGYHPGEMNCAPEATAHTREVTGYTGGDPTAITDRAAARGVDAESYAKALGGDWKPGGWESPQALVDDVRRTGGHIAAGVQFKHGAHAFTVTRTENGHVVIHERVGDIVRDISSEGVVREYRVDSAGRRIGEVRQTYDPDALDTWLSQLPEVLITGGIQFGRDGLPQLPLDGAEPGGPDGLRTGLDVPWDEMGNRPDGGTALLERESTRDSGPNGLDPATEAAFADLARRFELPAAPAPPERTAPALVAADTRPAGVAPESTVSGDRATVEPVAVPPSEPAAPLTRDLSAAVSAPETAAGPARPNGESSRASVSGPDTAPPPRVSAETAPTIAPDHGSVSTESGSATPRLDTAALPIAPEPPAIPRIPAAEPTRLSVPAPDLGTHPPDPPATVTGARPDPVSTEHAVASPGTEHSPSKVTPPPIPEAPAPRATIAASEAPRAPHTHDLPSPTLAARPGNSPQDLPTEPDEFRPQLPGPLVTMPRPGLVPDPGEYGTSYPMELPLEYEQREGGFIDIPGVPHTEEDTSRREPTIPREISESRPELPAERPRFQPHDPGEPDREENPHAEPPAIPWAAPPQRFPAAPPTHLPATPPAGPAETGLRPNHFPTRPDENTPGAPTDPSRRPGLDPHSLVYAPPLGELPRPATGPGAFPAPPPGKPVEAARPVPWAQGGTGGEPGKRRRKRQSPEDGSPPASQPVVMQQPADPGEKARRRPPGPATGPAENPRLQPNTGDEDSLRTASNSQDRPGSGERPATDRSPHDEVKAALQPQGPLIFRHVLAALGVEPRSGGPETERLIRMAREITDATFREALATWPSHREEGLVDWLRHTADDQLAAKYFQRIRTGVLETLRNTALSETDADFRLVEEMDRDQFERLSLPPAHNQWLRRRFWLGLDREAADSAIFAESTLTAALRDPEQEAIGMLLHELRSLRAGASAGGPEHAASPSERPAVESTSAEGIPAVLADPIPTTPTTNSLGLTPREITVLDLIAADMSNKEAAAVLGVSAETVKAHLFRIRGKLGIGERAAMVAIAIRAGISGNTHPVTGEPYASSAPPALSEQQAGILEKVAEGRSNKEIATTTGLTAYQVKNRLVEIGEILGARTRAGIVATALRIGALPLDSSSPPVEPESVSGHPQLSAGELAILHHVEQRKTNREIGLATGNSAATVDSVLWRIGRKLGTGDRTAMVEAARAAGILAGPGSAAEQSGASPVTGARAELTVRPGDRTSADLARAHTALRDLLAGTPLESRTGVAAELVGALVTTAEGAAAVRAVRGGRGDTQWLIVEVTDKSRATPVRDVPDPETGVLTPTETGELLALLDEKSRTWGLEIHRDGDRTRRFTLATPAVPDGSLRPAPDPVIDLTFARHEVAPAGGTVRGAVVDLLERAGWPEDRTEMIRTAVSEIFGNVALYAPEGGARVRGWFTGSDEEELVVEIADDSRGAPGWKFTAAEASTEPITAPADDYDPAAAKALLESIDLEALLANEMNGPRLGANRAGGTHDRGGRIVLKAASSIGYEMAANGAPGKTVVMHFPKEISEQPAPPIVSGDEESTPGSAPPRPAGGPTPGPEPLAVHPGNPEEAIGRRDRGRHNPFVGGPGYAGLGGPAVWFHHPPGDPRPGQREAEHSPAQPRGNPPERPARTESRPGSGPATPTHPSGGVTGQAGTVRTSEPGYALARSEKTEVAAEGATDVPFHRVIVRAGRIYNVADGSLHNSGPMGEVFLIGPDPDDIRCGPVSDFTHSILYRTQEPGTEGAIGWGIWIVVDGEPQPDPAAPEFKLALGGYPFGEQQFDPKFIAQTLEVLRSRGLDISAAQVSSGAFQGRMWISGSVKPRIERLVDNLPRNISGLFEGFGNDYWVSAVSTEPGPDYYSITLDIHPVRAHPGRVTLELRREDNTYTARYIDVDLGQSPARVNPALHAVHRLLAPWLAENDAVFLGGLPEPVDGPEPTDAAGENRAGPDEPPIPRGGGTPAPGPEPLMFAPEVDPLGNTARRGHRPGLRAGERWAVWNGIGNGPDADAAGPDARNPDRPRVPTGRGSRDEAAELRASVDTTRLDSVRAALTRDLAAARRDGSTTAADTTRLEQILAHLDELRTALDRAAPAPAPQRFRLLVHHFHAAAEREAAESDAGDIMAGRVPGDLEEVLDRYRAAQERLRALGQDLDSDRARAVSAEPAPAPTPWSPAAHGDADIAALRQVDIARLRRTAEQAFAEVVRAGETADSVPPEDTAAAQRAFEHYVALQHSFGLLDELLSTVELPPAVIDRNRLGFLIEHFHRVLTEPAYPPSPLPREEPRTAAARPEDRRPAGGSGPAPGPVAFHEVDRAEVFDLPVRTPRRPFAGRPDLDKALAFHHDADGREWDGRSTDPQAGRSPWNRTTAAGQPAEVVATPRLPGPRNWGRPLSSPQDLARGLAQVAAALRVRPEVLTEDALHEALAFVQAPLRQDMDEAIDTAMQSTRLHELPALMGEWIANRTAPDSGPSREQITAARTRTEQLEQKLSEILGLPVTRTPGDRVEGSVPLQVLYDYSGNSELGRVLETLQEFYALQQRAEWDIAPTGAPESMARTFRIMHSVPVEGHHRLTPGQLGELLHTLHTLLNRYPVRLRKVAILPDSEADTPWAVAQPETADREIRSPTLKIYVPDSFSESLGESVVQEFARILSLAGRWRAQAHAMTVLERYHLEEYNDPDGFTEWIREQFPAELFDQDGNLHVRRALADSFEAVHRETIGTDTSGDTVTEGQQVLYDLLVGTAEHSNFRSDHAFRAPSTEAEMDQLNQKRELIQYFETTLGLEVVGLDMVDVDVATVREIVEEILDHHEEFGDLTGLTKVAVLPLDGPDTFAETRAFLYGTHIVLNEEWLIDRNSFRSAVNHAVGIGHFISVPDEPVRTIVDHELGHVLHYFIHADRDPSEENIARVEDLGAVMPELFELFLESNPEDTSNEALWKWLRKILSGYSFKRNENTGDDDTDASDDFVINIAEAFAEARTAVRNLGADAGGPQLVMSAHLERHAHAEVARRRYRAVEPPGEPSGDSISLPARAAGPARPPATGGESPEVRSAAAAEAVPTPQQPPASTEATRPRDWGRPRSSPENVDRLRTKLAAVFGVSADVVSESSFRAALTFVQAPLEGLDPADWTAFDKHTPLIELPALMGEWMTNHTVLGAESSDPRRERANRQLEERLSEMLGSPVPRTPATDIEGIDLFIKLKAWADIPLLHEVAEVVREFHELMRVAAWDRAPTGTPAEMINAFLVMHHVAIQKYHMITDAETIEVVHILHQLLTRFPLKLTHVRIARSKDDTVLTSTKPVIMGRSIYQTYLDIYLPATKLPEHQLSDAITLEFAKVLTLAGRWRALGNASNELQNHYRQHHDPETNGFADWLAEQFPECIPKTGYLNVEKALEISFSNNYQEILGRRPEAGLGNTEGQRILYDLLAGTAEQWNFSNELASRFPSNEAEAGALEQREALIRKAEQDLGLQLSELAVIDYNFDTLREIFDTIRDHRKQFGSTTGLDKLSVAPIENDLTLAFVTRTRDGRTRMTVSERYVVARDEWHRIFENAVRTGHFISARGEAVRSTVAHELGHVMHYFILDGMDTPEPETTETEKHWEAVTPALYDLFRQENPTKDSSEEFFSWLLEVLSGYSFTTDEKTGIREVDIMEAFAEARAAARTMGDDTPEAQRIINEYLERRTHAEVERRRNSAEQQAGDDKRPDGPAAGSATYSKPSTDRTALGRKPSRSEQRAAGTPPDGPRPTATRQPARSSHSSLPREDDEPRRPASDISLPGHRTDSPEGRFEKLRTALLSVLAADTTDTNPYQLIADADSGELAAAFAALSAREQRALQQLAGPRPGVAPGGGFTRHQASSAVDRITATLESAQRESAARAAQAIADMKPEELRAALHRLTGQQQRLVIGLFEQRLTPATMASLTGYDEPTIELLTRGAVRRLARFIADDAVADVPEAVRLATRHPLAEPLTTQQANRLIDLARRDEPEVLRWYIEHRLHGDERRAAELLFADGEKVATVATRMDVSERRVRRLLETAREKLADPLAARLGIPDPEARESSFRRGQRLAQTAVFSSVQEETTALDHLLHRLIELFPAWQPTVVRRDSSPPAGTGTSSQLPNPPRSRNAPTPTVDGTTDRPSDDAIRRRELREDFGLRATLHITDDGAAPGLAPDTSSRGDASTRAGRTPWSGHSVSVEEALDLPHRRHRASPLWTPHIGRGVPEQALAFHHDHEGEDHDRGEENEAPEPGPTPESAGEIPRPGFLERMREKARPQNPHIARLYTGATFSTIGGVGLATYVPLLVEQMSDSAQLTGLTTSATAAAALLAQFPAGSIADRYDNRRVLRIVSATGLATTGIAGGWILAGLPGALEAVIGSAIIVAVTDTVAGTSTTVYGRALAATEEQKKATMTLALVERQASGSIGRFVIPMLGRVSPGLPFLADSASYGINLWALAKVPQVPAQPVSERARLLDGALATWRDSYLRGNVGLLVPWGFGAAASGVHMAEIINNTGYSATTAGLLMSASSTGVLLAAFTPKRLMDRINLKWMHPVTMATWTALMAGYATTTDPWILGTTSVAVGSTVMLTNKKFFEYQADVVPAKAIGGALSTTNIVNGVGGIIGGAVGGFVLQALGGAATGWMNAGIFGAAAATSTALALLTRKKPASTGADTEGQEPAETADTTSVVIENTAIRLARTFRAFGGNDQLEPDVTDPRWATEDNWRPLEEILRTQLRPIPGTGGIAAIRAAAESVRTRRNGIDTIVLVAEGETTHGWIFTNVEGNVLVFDTGIDKTNDDIPRVRNYDGDENGENKWEPAHLNKEIGTVYAAYFTAHDGVPLPPPQPLRARAHSRHPRMIRDAQ